MADRLVTIDDYTKSKLDRRISPQHRRDEDRCSLYDSVEQLQDIISIQDEVVVSIGESVKTNSESIQFIDAKIDTLNDGVKPIVEGINSIKESVKVLTWLAKAVKWLATIGVAIGIVIYGWSEHLADIFKSNNF